MIIIWRLLFSFLFTAGFITACTVERVGTVVFRANGEDFVRQGFESKDGWMIDFEHIYINLGDVRAHITDPAYNPEEGRGISSQSEIQLDGTYKVDLAKGGPDSEPILIGEVENAPAGHYNAVSWAMVPGDSGYPLIVEGTATKGEQTIDFRINVETGYAYTCGEYIGDERKGFLEEGGTTDLELTFHFDHIFGDGSHPMEDELNQQAPGFEPFANAAQNGNLEINLAGLQKSLPPEEFQMLVEILPTLGHIGEGHCHSEIP